MTTEEALVARVSQLEREVAALKRWIAEIFGTDPRSTGIPVKDYDRYPTLEERAAYAQLFGDVFGEKVSRDIPPHESAHPRVPQGPPPRRGY